MNSPRTKLKSMPSPIVARLAELRAALTRWVLTKGLARWVLLILAIIVIDIVLDRLFKMDFAQRSIMLVVMITLGVGLFYWRVLRPMVSRISDDALLHQIETRYPQLNEKLISGAQLAQLSDLEDKGVSKELADATIDGSIELAKSMDFGETINRKEHRKNQTTLGFGVGFLALIVLGIFQTEFLSTWFNRNILLGNAQWPQATYLKVVGVEDGVLVLPRGTDHRLIVEVTENSRIQDVSVTLEIENPNGTAIHTMKPTGKLGGREHLFVMHNVSSEMTLKAHGGDDETDSIDVLLVEPPAILDLKMSAEFPDYTRMPAQPLEGPGPHSLLPGSKIKGSVSVNKHLRSATVGNDQQKWDLDAAGDQNYEFSFPGNNQSLIGGKYEFNLVDQTGLASTRPTRFSISIKDDEAPKIFASLIGVSGLAVPKVRIPVTYKTSDDFGINELWFHTNWRNVEIEGDDGSGSRDVSIAQFFREEDVVRQAEDRTELELEPFNLKPGTSFKLLVRVSDTLPQTPNISDSVEFLIRIVSPEELRADLLRREIEQRKAFQQAYDAQLELSSELQAVAAMVPRGETPEMFDADRQKRMITLARNQKLIGTKLDAIASSYEGFLQESQNNRLDEDVKDLVGEQTLAERFEKQIIGPIRAMDAELISLASRELDNCRRLLNEQNQLLAAVDETTALHQQILDEMKKIMDAMVQSETFQGVINKLLEIKRGEDQIKSEIQRRKPDEKDIFDEDDIFDDN